MGGIYYWLPCIYPRTINQGRAKPQPATHRAHKRRRGSHKASAEHPGQAPWPDAECLAGDSCWCSGAPAPSGSLQTREPSDGNWVGGGGECGGSGADGDRSSHLPNSLGFQMGGVIHPHHQQGREMRSCGERGLAQGHTASGGTFLRLKSQVI